MARAPIIKLLHVDLQLMIHASESPQKIETLMKVLIPIENEDEWNKIQKKIEKHSLKGHHGNPIQMWQLRLPARLGRLILVHLLPKIHKDNFDVENRFAEQFYPHENAFYFRLSKHDLLRSPPRFTLTEHGDSVRFRVKFQMFKAKKDRPRIVKDFLRSFLTDKANTDEHNSRD